MCFLRWTLSIFGCVEKLKVWGMEKNTIHHEIWARANYLFFELGKIRHFLFLALQGLCFSWSYSFEKGLIFSEKGLKIWREGLAAEERLLQNVKIEIENVLNSLLLPGSAENAPARRDHSETWQMPGYIKAMTRTLSVEISDSLKNQVWGDQQLGRTSRNGGKNAGSGLSWRKYLGCLKWQGQYYRLGPSPTLRSFSKLRQNWEELLS